MYIFSFRILFVCKASHTPPWLCRHTMILILLWFMFHSLHISKVVRTELQPTSRLVNSSLEEVLLHLGQLCSIEVQHKMVMFKTAPMETQQKFSPYFTKAGLGQACHMLQRIKADPSWLSFLTPSPQCPHPSAVTNILSPPLLPLSSILLSLPTSFAQLGSSQRWFLQALIYEWYRQRFGNLPLRANFLLCGTPAFNSRERKQPAQ